MFPGDSDPASPETTLGKLLCQLFIPDKHGKFLLQSEHAGPPLSTNPTLTRKGS